MGRDLRGRGEGLEEDRTGRRKHVGKTSSPTAVNDPPSTVDVHESLSFSNRIKNSFFQCVHLHAHFFSFWFYCLIFE